MSTTTTFRRLAGLPPYGPMAIGFPKEWARFGSEGIVVEFCLADGTSWVGNFSKGLGGLVDVRWHPNQEHVLVVARGALWCVDPVARTADELVPAIFDIHELETGDLILDCQGLAFMRIGPAGIVWQTRRISWDGFRNVRIEGGRIFGESWSLDHWLPFSVDLGSGKVDGGCNTGPE